MTAFYVPSFFRMPARFGTPVSASVFVFLFVALWSHVEADCCGNSIQKFGLGGNTDCPCPSQPPCNLFPTVQIFGLHNCNLLGCDCDECDATKLCPQIPAVKFDFHDPNYGDCCPVPVGY